MEGGGQPSEPKTEWKFNGHGRHMTSATPVAAHPLTADSRFPPCDLEAYTIITPNIYIINL